MTSNNVSVSVVRLYADSTGIPLFPDSEMKARWQRQRQFGISALSHASKLRSLVRRVMLSTKLPSRDVNPTWFVVANGSVTRVIGLPATGYPVRQRSSESNTSAQTAETTSESRAEAPSPPAYPPRCPAPCPARSPCPAPCPPPSRVPTPPPPSRHLLPRRLLLLRLLRRSPPPMAHTNPTWVVAATACSRGRSRW